jgi:selenide,water dikinase
MGQGDLARILAALPPVTDGRVLVGASRGDDGAVFRLADDLALVATLDFFTPIVDDPYEYGAIAAANSLSDVYAMGGEPLYALAIAAFPPDPETLALLPDVLLGAADTCREAGIAIVGGHTVKDREPKFGLSVTGRIHPGKVWENRGAAAGDAIVLTKPLGTGVVSTAIKRGVATPEEAAGAVRWMRRLNRGAAGAAREAGVRTATDVTGFGLLGHLLEVLEASALSATVRASAVPALGGARERLAGPEPPVPGGARENLSFQGGEGRCAFDPAVPEGERLLLCDPQTSGGLLLFTPPERVETLLAELGSRGESGWVVGETGPSPAPGAPRIVVVP